MRRTYIVITAVSAAMVLGGATALAVALRAGQDRGKPEPIAYAPAVSPSQPPIPPAAALAQTLRQMRGGAVVAARIGEAPADSRRGNLPWLYAAVRVPGMARGLDVEPIWEADLIEGVVADRAGTARDIRDDFGGSTFDAVLPDGSRIADASGGLGDIVRGQQFRGTETVSAKLSIERELQRAGLTPISVNVLRPAGPAPAVIASTSDVATTAKSFVPLVRALFGSPPNYEGYYLELRDNAGNAFVRASAAFRTGAGRLWVEPKWADLVGAKNGGHFARLRAGSGSGS